MPRSEGHVAFRLVVGTNSKINTLIGRDVRSDWLNNLSVPLRH